MEETIDCIIREWKDTHSIESNHSNVCVKYQDHDLGIYTIYFNIGNDTIRLKAIRTTPDTLINKLKNTFGLHKSSIFKITDMS